jgi:hypothetical protein
VPLPVVLGALPEEALRAAVAGGGVVAEDGWVAVEELADAEAALADEVLGLASENRLALVLGPVPAGADVVEVGDVHRRPLADVAAELQAVPPELPVVLGGDPDALAGAAPGAVLADLLGWGQLPVRDLRGEDVSTALAALVVGLRRGELPEPGDTSVVLVPCADDSSAARRVGQLVGDSIPRVFGVRSHDVLVVTVQKRGDAGVRGLAEGLPEGVWVGTVHDAVATAQSAEAVVACFPAAAAGALTRRLVYSAAMLAGRHLSVVTAAGDALPRAVVGGAEHRRWTRLPTLLRAGAD